ncbi:hypothetical protein SRB17_86430 [Streptomyces sp. RB17]|nr:hypothetical protein [Streptomyces sp. RB17]
MTITASLSPHQTRNGSLGYIPPAELEARHSTTAAPELTLKTNLIGP